MKSFLIALFLSILLCVAGCSPKAGTSSAPAPLDKAAAAGAPKADLTFATALKPVIDERCGDCHTQEMKGKFSMLTRESAMAGGKSGPVIAPGNAENSLLYKMIAGKPGVKRMPPKGNPLSDAQIASIKSWIDSGAK